MVKVRRGYCTIRRNPNINIGASTMTKKKTMMSIKNILVWSLALFHLFNCCNWVLATEEVEGNDDSELNYETAMMSDMPFYEWSPNQGSFRNNNWMRYHGVSPFLMNTKRAVYGILGLATKRPHKTAAEIQYLPPQDSFMSVRGRKKRSLKKPSRFSPNPFLFDLRQKGASVSELILPTQRNESLIA